ncbi:MAG: radical protein [Paenibacillus sp.]|jgi:aminodeoxyfutalosine synthase|uniref:aminofutalosine synthase MqnE n=1 Tax=Paenibacillus sp. V4I5 TaxID=3042306 RepID=UPI00279205B0|nr:aminofutalosine synthase MqnE [Paenibacillus sp. V4I5]MDF2651471.1 radical protein [Paenibacillus sp.]MDQ0919820.1 aminodeoxyfutalosine synthase [Paenibacillus sp. V4I5]
MSVVTTDPVKRMAEIADKVENGQRLSMEDGLFLYESDDLLTIGQLANKVNTRMNGNKVYFVQNMSLYFTNVCEEHCAFCHFRRDEGEEGSYTLTPSQMLDYVAEHFNPEIKEFHISQGHNPHLPFEYYVDCIRQLKQAYPDVTIKAHTAAEIEFFSRISGLSFRDVLKTLMDAGLSTLPGGGAEILTERYRTKMKVEKASSEEWIDVHRNAHMLGMKTHATMLYGSIETKEERIRHMLLLRELQDETGGFLVFIPNSIQPASKNAGLKHRVAAWDELKTIAISRLMLDNFPHIKAYFINIGTKLTQLSFTFGASDAHGTIVKEKISHAAGALSPEGLTRDELVYLIKGAGRVPVERDTFYNEIRVY